MPNPKGINQYGGGSGNPLSKKNFDKLTPAAKREALDAAKARTAHIKEQTEKIRAAAASLKAARKRK